jgi:four helix bundle protein
LRLGEKETENRSLTHCSLLVAHCSLLIAFYPSRNKVIILWTSPTPLRPQLHSKLPKSEEYNLKQQLKRAVVSVSLNIAEGKNRRTAKDFINFLNISNGSLAETEAILLICAELGLLSIPEDLLFHIEELGKMIKSLIASIRTKLEV